MPTTEIKVSERTVRMECSNCGKSLSFRSRLPKFSVVCPICGTRHHGERPDRKPPSAVHQPAPSRPVEISPAATRPLPLEKPASKEPEGTTEAGSDDGFFGPEMRAFRNGIPGGVAMMAIAVVWFVVGLQFDRIFFYPPILFLFGVAACIKGVFDLICGPSVEPTGANDA